MKQDEKIQYIGFFLVSATLLYFPYVVFLVGFILVLLIFTKTITRRYFLIGYGFFLPVILVGIYYWFRDGLGFFWNQFVLSAFSNDPEKLMLSSSLLVIASVPALFTVFSILKLFGRIRYTNFQITLIQAVILLFGIGGIGYWISPVKTPHSLLIFLPFAAFLISHFFMLIKRKFLSEIIFLSFLLLILLWNLGGYIKISPVNRLVDYSQLIVAPSKWDKLAEGKKVMLLTSEISVLQKCELATPGLTWKISSQVYQNPGEYSKILLAYQYIRKENPDLIIDPSGLMTDFFQKMPILKPLYKQSGEFWIRQE